MAEWTRGTIGEATIATSCLICNAAIPVFGRDYSPKVCTECKRSVAEVKWFLARVKKHNPFLEETMNQEMNGL